MTTEYPAKPDSSPPQLVRLKAGMRIRVTQQIPRLSGAMVSQPADGVVVRFGQQKTGSWFAHSEDDKLWLDRVEIRKDDGELVVMNLDQFSRVELI